MRKLLLSLMLCMPLMCVYGGYIIRGININHPFDNLKNYTLIVKEGVPLSAASVNIGPGEGRNTVLIISSDLNVLPIAFTGQLLQFGTTNPDISTAQLSKGMYILRLENGKVYKFVK